MLWGEIEESEKVSSHLESSPGHLACAGSALPRSYDNWTTTNSHNSLICTAQMVSQQLLSMSHRNSIRGQTENSLHQERTHAECFFCLFFFTPNAKILASHWRGAGRLFRLSGCHTSVAEHWLHKASVLGSIYTDCQPFHLFYFVS